MAAHGATLREARRKTGNGITTVAEMARGIIPIRNVVIEFAVGLGEPVDEWLRLSGYLPT